MQYSFDTVAPWIFIEIAISPSFTKIYALLTQGRVGGLRSGNATRQG